MQTASRKASGKALIRARAVESIGALLFSTGESYSLDQLQAELRKIFSGDANEEYRAIASLSKMELIAAILESDEPASKIGQKIIVTNGMVSLWAVPKSKKMIEHLQQKTGETGNPAISETMLETLACIAYRQPISQSKINKTFDVDRRSVIARLIEQEWIDRIPGTDGESLFVVSQKFLRAKGFATHADLLFFLESKENIAKAEASALQNPIPSE